MSVHDVLVATQNSGVAHLISKSNHLVGAALQIVHVAGIISLLSAVVLISLRISGLALKDQPLADIVQDTRKLVWWGLGLAVSSGALMFISTATLYAYKSAFQIKLVLFAVAVILQVTLVRKIEQSKTANQWLAKGAVIASLIIWFGVGFAGRMIGFV
jgi:uncharacterized membrane protein YcfT